MKNLSTRNKLILLVVVPALPVLALTLYSALEERALNLAGIALATILLVLGAWYGTEVFVLRNIRTLLDTARRVRSGDLGARTGLHRERDELNQVGREFDEMAETLQQRDLELKKAMQELQEQAITDPLTGLHNTRYLRELLPGELLRAKRKGSPLAVIMIDVDHFKRVNDTHGHAAGDAVLIEFARRLRNSVRAPDIVARLSGDEFAIMVGELDDIGQVEHVAAHIVDALAAPFEFEDKRLSISASIGIGFSAHGLESAQSLVARADRKLYQAKAAGRGRFSSAREPNAA